MNYEKSPIPWKARPIYPSGELGWMVEASNGAIIGSGLTKEIAELISKCPEMFGACEVAFSLLDSDLYVGYSSYENKKHALYKISEAIKSIK